MDEWTGGVCFIWDHNLPRDAQSYVHMYVQK